MSSPIRNPIQLIVNADDYGYFRCVSRGIRHAADEKAISALGVLATSPNLDHQLRWLKGSDEVDMGVHLNLTYGCPLSSRMSDGLDAWGGRFPRIGAIAWAILRGALSLDAVRCEWQTQIETCLIRDLTIQFLNSHEHVHMLPPLFALTLELASEYGIKYIRITEPDWLFHLGVTAQLRNWVIAGLKRLNQRRLPSCAPRCIGIGRSGRLDLGYLARLFSRLQPGEVYELVCHPGYHDRNEMTDPRLAAFHDWEGELGMLTGAALRKLYRDYGIQLVGYRSLRHNEPC